MNFKIRPFDDTCEAQIKHIKGDIIEDKFILTLDSANYEIPITEVNNDHHGIFAIVNEGIIELGFEYFIEIKLEYGDETRENLHGCAISFEKRKDPNDIGSKLIANNIDHVNLLSRTSDPFMILYFSQSGVLNGRSFPLQSHKEEKVIAN
jgi:hypothetical protein